MVWSFLLSLLAFLNSFLPQATFVEGVLGQPQSLYGLELGTNLANRDPARFLHRGLLKYNEKGDLVGDLAEAYKVSDDKKEYTFKLQKSVFWHDGSRFTADDVIFTASQQQLQVVEVDKLTDFEVRFRLVKDPYTPFLDLMTAYVVKANYGKVNKESLYQVGTGDFRVARVKKSARIEEIILTRAWPGNGGKPWPYRFSRLIFKFYERAADLELAGRLGEIDAFGREGGAATLTGFDQIKAPLGSRYYALFLNLTTEFLKDREFRKALKESLDRKKIVESVYQGLAEPSYYPLEHTFADPDREVLSKIPKSTWKKSGEVKLKITVPGDFNNQDEKINPRQKTAAIIKAVWEEALGIEVEIKPVPLNKVFSEVIAKKDFEVILFGQEVGRDPDVYTLWHSTQKDLPGLNFVSYESPLADRALEEGRKTDDKEERKRHYNNFVKVFDEDTPAIFLIRPIFTYSFKENIQGPNLK